MDNAENMTSKELPGDEPYDAACNSMPDLTRMRYFHGQMLAANDLQTEQQYFHEKLKLHNRCLHGYGTVCGLKVVEVEKQSDCAPSNDKQAQKIPTCVQIECGLALDCQGNELVVRRPLIVHLWDELTEIERSQINNSSDKKARIYLSICYCVQPLDPVRPVLPDACGAVSECVYSKLRDAVRVKVSLEKPDKNHCRNNCCDKCADKCLLLAAIDFEKGKAVTAALIRNDVRRWVTLYEPVTITGISWVHDAPNYTVREAAKMLQKQGLTIRFSRPVLKETITKGIFDVWVLEGGRGRNANLYYVDGDVTIHPNLRQLVFRQSSGEKLQDGDRVMITVRAEFILDECCRPVDGNHVGGRVPLLPEYTDNKPDQSPYPARTSCIDPPNRYGPWTSGNGSPGGNFESWFYIKEPAYADYKDSTEKDPEGGSFSPQDE